MSGNFARPLVLAAVTLAAGAFGLYAGLWGAIWFEPAFPAGTPGLAGTAAAVVFVPCGLTAGLVAGHGLGLWLTRGRSQPAR